MSQEGGKLKIASQVAAERIRNVMIVSGSVAVIGAILYPVYVRFLPFSVPPWVAHQAKQRAPGVRLGMTDAQVWSTLGLQGRGFRAHVEGSGPPEAYPANYVLWPGYVIHARWNLRAKPAKVVEFSFRDHL